MTRSWAVFSPADKLKILVGFYMIATKVEKVYDLYFPAEVRALLNTFTIWFSLGMEGIPLECVGAVGYEKKLQLWEHPTILSGNPVLEHYI